MAFLPRVKDQVLRGTTRGALLKEEHGEEPAMARSVWPLLQVWVIMSLGRPDLFTGLRFRWGCRCNNNSG